MQLVITITMIEMEVVRTMVAAMAMVLVMAITTMIVASMDTMVMIQQ